jgi:hypothetical protein
MQPNWPSKAMNRYGLVLMLAGTYLVSASALAARQSLTDVAPIDAEDLMRRTSEEAFVEIKQKYVELQQNFTPHFLTTGLDLDCRIGTKVPLDGRTFSGLRIDNQTTQSSGTPNFVTRTSVSHYDCFAKLVFVERMSVTAPTARPFTVEQAVRFKRAFQATGDEVYRGYQLEDETGKTIFEVRSQRADTANTIRHFTLIQLGGKDFVRVDQVDLKADERKLRIRVYADEFPLAGSRFTVGLGAPSILFEQLWNSERLVHEIETKEVSQVKFDENIQNLVVQISSMYMKAAFASFIPILPTTVKVASGVADSPFLRELQLNYNRLITKTEDAQVRRFFERTIRDIKEGRLKVD